MKYGDEADVIYYAYANKNLPTWKVNRNRFSSLKTEILHRR